jgi:hypothetical protein
MKTLLICLLIVTGAAYAQDRSATPTDYFYVDSLKSGTLDTVDVVFTFPRNFEYYEVTAWSGAADTLTVWILAADGSRYVQRGVYSLAAGGSAAVEMVTSTTVKDWAIITGPQITGLRFLSPGSTNDIHFIVSGRRGSPIY